MTNSCCLCWSCRNPHFASAVSFHSCRFSIIPTVDVIVQVNMHSFLPCFTNMHSALIQESDTFHNSYWLFLVWGGGNTLTAVTRSHCLVVGILYVVLMERRAFAFSFFLRGKTPTRLFGYPCACSAHHCSQVQWAHFFCHCSFVCFAIWCLRFLYKHKRKFSKMTSNNPTATWLLLNMWC